MRHRLAFLALLLALASGASAAAPPASPRESDRLDYLFLGGDRPTLIRLHVRVGDKPYGAAWDEFVDELFDWFDKDRDGSLSPTETARLPSALSLRGQTQGGIGTDTSGVAFAAIDANKDGKVSRGEFREFYRKGGYPDLQFATNNSQARTAKQIDDVIYQRLDKSGEGTLTAAKVAGLYEKLRALDVNEDEMVDQGELSPRVNFVRDTTVKSVNSGRVVVNVVEPTLRVIDSGRVTSLLKQMLDKYDRDKDGKLTRAEIGLAPALFARLDADGDGTLDAAELRGYLASTPDLVLRLQVGTPGARKGVPGLFPAPRLVAVDEKTLAADVAKTFRRAGSDSIAVELGDTRMAFQAATARVDENGRFADAKVYYSRQFDTIAGKKGYVERADGKGQQAFLFLIFSQADKNVDGRLTRAELLDWLDFMASGENRTITITAHDLGRSLFGVLDADGDGRLSLREMNGAWARLKPLAKGGKVTRAEIPRSLRIVVGRGTNADFRPVPNAPAAPRPANRPDAPDWFRKMDKNGDGDVSRKEWLGTDEEFAKIDADGDGLIGAEEATAFEGKKKTKEKE